MNNLPVNPISPQQQQKLLGQIYRLMEQQVESYHKHRHMGRNTSVPSELAQELLESIEYTAAQAGGFGNFRNAEEALRAGQDVLLEKHIQAKQLLKLVEATTPSWQTECRWDALRCLDRYLTHYDPMHLAHKGPDALFYPILLAPTDGMQGIDLGIFYLKILWAENRIIACFDDETLDALWDRIPPAALNPSEQVLVNAIGKVLIGAETTPLVFSWEEHQSLYAALSVATEADLQDASGKLCKKLDLSDEDTIVYVKAIIPQIQLWTGENIPFCSLENVFL